MAGRKRSTSVYEKPLEERKKQLSLAQLSDANFTTRKGVMTQLGRGEIHFKTIFIGESGCGKTQLVRRLIRAQFNPAVQSTVKMDTYELPVELTRCQVTLDVWDTAGQEKYHALTPQFFRDSLICVVVYDITDRRSFERCQFWIDLYANKTHPTPPAVTLIDGKFPNMALVGTKTDMDHMRAVARKEAEECATKHCMAFAEVTAVNGQGAGELERLVHALATNAFNAIQGKRRNSDPNVISIREHTKSFVPNGHNQQSALLVSGAPQNKEAGDEETEGSCCA